MPGPKWLTRPKPASVGIGKALARRVLGGRINVPSARPMRGSGRRPCALDSKTSRELSGRRGRDHRRLRPGSRPLADRRPSGSARAVRAASPEPARRRALQRDPRPAPARAVRCGRRRAPEGAEPVRAAAAAAGRSRVRPRDRQRGAGAAVVASAPGRAVARRHRGLSVLPGSAELRAAPLPAPRPPRRRGRPRVERLGAQHFAEIQAFTVTGRPLLVGRVQVFRPPGASGVSPGG
jgi:hypothetical protein